MRRNGVKIGSVAAAVAAAFVLAAPGVASASSYWNPPRDIVRVIPPSTTATVAPNVSLSDGSAAIDVSLSDSVSASVS
jgi:hypothetical protein